MWVFIDYYYCWLFCNYIFSSSIKTSWLSCHSKSPNIYLSLFLLSFPHWWNVIQKSPFPLLIFHLRPLDLSSSLPSEAWAPWSWHFPREMSLSWTSPAPFTSWGLNRPKPWHLRTPSSLNHSHFIFHRGFAIWGWDGRWLSSHTSSRSRHTLTEPV